MPEDGRGWEGTLCLGLLGTYSMVLGIAMH